MLKKNPGDKDEVLAVVESSKKLVRVKDTTNEATGVVGVFKKWYIWVFNGLSIAWPQSVFVDKLQ